MLIFSHIFKVFSIYLCHFVNVRQFRMVLLGNIGNGSRKILLDFGAGGKIPLLRPERWRRFKEEAACFGAGWKTSHLRPIRCNFDAITCFFFGASTDFSHLRRPSHRPASKSMLFFGASSIFSPLHRIHHKSPPEIPIIHKCSVTPKPTPTFPTKNVMHFRA